MRSKYFLHGAGLTMIGALCLSIATAAQTQPTSLNRLIPKITSDAIGFDSGLWRSEYLQQPKQDEDEAPASTAMENGSASGSAKSPPPEFAYSDTLITIPLDTPALIDPQMQDVNGESSLQEDSTMSEWENIVSVAGASKTPGYTTSGPSITSAIVGCVGIMIVIGAYISSGKRNG